MIHIYACVWHLTREKSVMGGWNLCTRAMSFSWQKSSRNSKLVHIYVYVSNLMFDQGGTIGGWYLGTSEVGSITFFGKNSTRQQAYHWGFLASFKCSKIGRHLAFDIWLVGSYLCMYVSYLCMYLTFDQGGKVHPWVVNVYARARSSCNDFFGRIQTGNGHWMWV